MEVVKISDPGSLKEVDVRRNIDYLRYISYTMSLGHDIRKEMKNVLDLFLGGKSRVLRLLCYPIIKEYAEIDYNDIQEMISADLTSTDPELQLNAIKLLYNFPVGKQLELFKTHEKDFQKMLIVPEFHYEKLICLNDYLLKCLVKSSLSENNENEKIYDFYSKISELVFHSSRDFSATALYVLKNLYSQYAQLSHDVYRQDQYFDGNGGVDKILEPLIINLTNSLFPNFNGILMIISGYEIRTRASLVTFAVTLLDVALNLFSKNYYTTKSDLLIDTGKKDLQLVMHGNVTIPIKVIVKNLIEETLLKDLDFQSYELDVWVPTYMNLFKILSLTNTSEWSWVIKYEEKCEILKRMFTTFSENLRKISYKRDLNLVLLNFANFTQHQNNSYRLTQSMKILEFGEKYIYNSIDRLLLYLISLISIVRVSLELVEEGKKSAIFGLFQQSWFLSRVQDKEDPNSVRFKDEFLISLMKSCIFIQHDLLIRQRTFKSYPAILMEILDLATRIIDWKMENKSYNADQKTSYLQTLDLYCVLLEYTFEFSDSIDAHNHINELIKRINAKELAFDVKLKVLNSLTKKLSPEVLMKLNMNDLLGEFKSTLMNDKVKATLTEQFIQNLTEPSVLKTFIMEIELMLDILYYSSFKTTQEARNIIVNILNDYQEYLSKNASGSKVFQPLVASISDYVELILRSLMNEEQLNLSEIKINMNFLNQIEFPQDEEYDESESFKSFTNLSYAFNIFYMKSFEKNEIFDSDTLENGNPIENLSYIYLQNSGKDEMNYRSSESKLISGIGDIIQIQAQHGINAAHSLISVNLRLINLNRFVVEKVKIRALYPNNLELYPEITNPKFAFIESFSPSEIQSVSFSFYVKRAVTVNIAFEIMLDISEIENPVRFKTLPYSISFLEFAVPNHMMASHRMLFENIWQNISYNYVLKSKLLTSEKQLFQGLRKNKLYVSTFSNQEKWKKAYMLGYTWDNNTIAVIVTNEAHELPSTDNQIFTIEIRSSNMEIIENVKGDDSTFINLISNGNLEFLY